jgi:hypothetical protein
MQKESPIRYDDIRQQKLFLLWSAGHVVGPPKWRKSGFGRGDNASDSEGNNQLVRFVSQVDWNGICRKRVGGRRVSVGESFDGVFWAAASTLRRMYLEGAVVYRNKKLVRGGSEESVPLVTETFGRG